MAKSKILKELASENVNLESVLSRLLIIASDLNNDKLAEWAKKELYGYSVDDDAPEYRKTGAGRIIVDGENASHKGKLPLQLTFFPAEIQEVLNKRVTLDSVNLMI